MGKQNVGHNILQTMPIKELWQLYTEVSSILAAKAEARKVEIEKQLEALARNFGGSPKDIPQPRPYPPVLPKFRNPQLSSETWSGRGKQPRWVMDVLARGVSLDDCRIQ
jgi:DNA-binding protein H-NS